MYSSIQVCKIKFLSCAVKALSCKQVKYRLHHTLNTLCHVVVEYQRHVLDVNASASDVRSDEDVFAAALQHCQSKFTLLLPLAAVKSDCIVLDHQIMHR